MPTFTTFDGIGLYYETLGEGPTVLLLHGFASSGFGNWKRSGIADAIAEAGYRTVAFDARGHGRSDKPHDPSAYHRDAMVKDAQSMMDFLDVDSVFVTGYSMGARTTLNLIAVEPRVTAAVVAGVGERSLDRMYSQRTEIAEALEAEDPAQIKEGIGLGFRQFAEATGADLVALAASQRAIKPEKPDWSSIKIPILLAVGDGDTLAGSVQFLVEEIPGAEFVGLRGDHLRAVGDPRFRQAIVAFLKKHIQPPRTLYPGS